MERNCDGQISVDPICVAGPDAFPLDPSAYTDTDGDGNQTQSLVTQHQFLHLRKTWMTMVTVLKMSTKPVLGPTMDQPILELPLNPDTDYDGICDGPVDVSHPQTGDLICVAGPDTD